MVALLVISFLAGVALVLVLKGWDGPAPSGVKSPAPAAVLTDQVEPAEVLPVSTGLRGAIIIDDMGARMSRFRSLAELDYKVTFAVLPYLRSSSRIVKEATDQGFEVMLHQPMEPGNTAVYRPGKGALYTAMTPDEIRERLVANMRDLPEIKGINNHMGSRFTEDAEGMAVVFEVLAERGLFFVDSKTSPRSVAGKLAVRYGIKTASRDVFLDNEQDKAYIEGQFREFIRIVKRRGTAIAIGHPYPETIEVLTETQAELLEAGITIVNVSELLK